MMAIAAGDTPGALDESLWQYDETTDTGYYGFVPASDFITGLDLATLTGFSSGSNHNSDAGWLKFYVGPTAVCNSTPGTAKCIFIAKQSLKYNVSWNHINSAGLVYGTTQRTVLDQSYNVRLITGGEASPGTGSEWNELMYRVHAEQPESKSNWETYENNDLNLSGNGCRTRCQEVPSNNVFRGRFNIKSFLAGPRHDTYFEYGWRPVLEYVPQTQ